MSKASDDRKASGDDGVCIVYCRRGLECHCTKRVALGAWFPKPASDRISPAQRELFVNAMRLNKVLRRADIYDSVKDGSLRVRVELDAMNGGAIIDSVAASLRQLICVHLGMQATYQVLRNQDMVKPLLV